MSWGMLRESTFSGLLCECGQVMSHCEFSLDKTGEGVCSVWGTGSLFFVRLAKRIQSGSPFVVQFPFLCFAFPLALSRPVVLSYHTHYSLVLHFPSLVFFSWSVAHTLPDSSDAALHLGLWSQFLPKHIGTNQTCTNPTRCCDFLFFLKMAPILSVVRGNKHSQNQSVDTKCITLSLSCGH